jgi:hypothetical protein
MKHGKPVFLPEMASEPQGTPVGMRAEEIGESECHPVIGWI